MTYTWDAWYEDDDGNTAEFAGLRIEQREFAVTEAGDFAILDFCDVAENKREFFRVLRDCNGRAYVYNIGGQQIYTVESTLDGE